MGSIITAKDFNAMLDNFTSSTIKVFRNLYATTGAYTFDVSSIPEFANKNNFKSFDAYTVISGTNSASHWGRIGNTLQQIGAVTQSSKGIFNVNTFAGRYGWGAGAQSSLYYDIIIIGRYADGFTPPRKQYPTIGLTQSNPARSAKAIRENGKDAVSGIYWIKPDGITNAFQCYCDFDKDGSWMLVWSNLRGKLNHKTTGISWDNATNGVVPLFNGTPSNDKEAWEVYTPLTLWNKMMGSKNGRMKYEWRHNYNTPLRDKVAICNLQQFSSTDNFTIRLTNPIKDAPYCGLYNYHNNRPFSTLGKNNSVYHNCPTYYSNTPWWYLSCWSGSINGGGENNGHGYLNGAYWVDSAKAWGVPNGSGAGNGWIFVEEI